MRHRFLLLLTGSCLLAAAGHLALSRAEPAKAPTDTTTRYFAPAPAPLPTKARGTTVLADPARNIRPGDKDLPNFAIVVPGIYRGAAPTAQGLRRLKALGVQTVIDLRIENKGQKEEAAAARALGLARLRLPMGREAPTVKQVTTFLSVLQDPARRPVFVHCQHGADRTGAMIGIWRVTQERWDFKRTWAEMRRFGFKPWLTELKQSVAQRAR